MLSGALSELGQSGVVYEISHEMLSSIGGILAVVGVVICPITSGDTAFRSARLILAEWTGLKQTKIKNRLILTIPMLAVAVILTQIDFDIMWRYFSLANQALAWFPPRVRIFADQIGVRVGRTTIRNQKTRWGSCSAQGNLNFNCLLMLCPPEIRDYVIVHELCHRLEMNHSPRFWAAVEKVLPDYRQRRKWLKTEGQAILARMTAG